MEDVIKKIDMLKSKNIVYELGHKPEDFEVMKKRAEKFIADTTKLKIFAEDINSSKLMTLIGVFNKKAVIIEKEKNGVYNLDLTGTTDKINIKGDNYGTLFIDGVAVDFAFEDKDWEHIPRLLNKFVEKNTGYRDEDNKVVIKSKEDLKKKILAKISEHKDWDYTLEVVNSFLWLIGAEKLGEIKMPESEDVEKIIKVLQIDDLRIYIQTHKNKEGNLHIKTVTPKHKEYNYIDEGRIIYDDVLYIADDLLDSYDSDILGKIKQSYRLDRYGNNNFMVIDVGIYSKSAHRFKLEKKKEEEDETLKKVLGSEINLKIDSLDQEGFKYQGIEFGHHFITYEGQKIGGKKVKLKKFISSKIKFDENIDFNNIYNDFIKVILEQWELYVESNFDFILGKMNINLGLKETETKIGLQKRYSINSVRINKEEREECLRRALCFDEQKGYNDFLSSVSKCSLRFHKYIENGLRINFRDNVLGDEDLTIKLKIIRKKNLNYIELPDKKLIQVKDSNRLFGFGSDERFRAYHTYDELFTFLNGGYGLSDEDISLIVKDGIKEYKEAIKRSEELLQSTLKQYKCKASQLTISGTTYKGYTVKGTSGRSYFVSDTDGNDKHAVYDVSDNIPKHICIVDKSLGADVGKDKIVARLCALANDSYLAKDIKTLGLPA